MPLQEIVSGWDQQPQEAADLGPLAEDFPSIFLGGYDVRSGAGLTATTQAVGPVGREARLALSNGQNTAISPAIRNGANWAFVAALRRTSTVAGAAYFLGIDTGGAPSFATHFSSTGRAFFWDGSGIRDAGFSLAVDEQAVVGLAFDSASSNYLFFKNGVLTATVAGSSIAAGSAWRWFTNDANTTNLALLAFSDRRVSVQRMAALTENPWQLFVRRDHIPYTVSAGGVTLTIQSATHAQLAGNLTLTSGTLLTVADALHAQLADNVVLSTVNEVSLAVDPATHTQLAYSLTLSTTNATALSVADAVHAQLADAVTLTTAQVLDVASALHAQIADQLTLSANNDIALTINGATHAQLADGVTLNTATWLAIASALHAQLADNVALTGGVVVTQGSLTVYLRRRRR